MKWAWAMGCGLAAVNYGFTLEHALALPGWLDRPQISEPHFHSFPFSESGAELEDLHVKQVPMWCWCCQSRDHTLRTTETEQSKSSSLGASLVAQWLRICLPMQGTRVRALVWEDPTCRGAAGPVSHNYWACTSGACALQWERPWQWEARAPRWRVAPACRN